MSDPVPTLYQRYRESGVRQHNRAGVALALKTGDSADADAATWLVGAVALGFVPLPGDYHRDSAGRWWEVRTVGPQADGSYPLACERWKDGQP